MTGNASAMVRLRDFIANNRLWLFYAFVGLVPNTVVSVYLRFKGFHITVLGYDMTSFLTSMFCYVLYSLFIYLIYKRHVVIFHSPNIWLWPRHWWHSDLADWEQIAEMTKVREWCQKRKQPFVMWRKGSDAFYYGFKSADLMVECRLTV